MKNDGKTFEWSITKWEWLEVRSDRSFVMGKYFTTNVGSKNFVDNVSSSNSNPKFMKLCAFLPSTPVLFRSKGEILDFELFHATKHLNSYEFLNQSSKAALTCVCT